MLVSSGLETRAEGRVGREERGRTRDALRDAYLVSCLGSSGGRRQSSPRDRATLCMRWLGGKVRSDKVEWMRQMEKQAVEG